MVIRSDGVKAMLIVHVVGDRRKAPRGCSWLDHSVWRTSLSELLAAMVSYHGRWRSYGGNSSDRKMNERTAPPGGGLRSTRVSKMICGRIGMKLQSGCSAAYVQVFLLMKSDGGKDGGRGKLDPDHGKTDMHVRHDLAHLTVLCSCRIALALCLLRSRASSM